METRSSSMPVPAILDGIDDPLDRLEDDVEVIMLDRMDIDRIPPSIRRFTSLKWLSLRGTRVGKIEHLDNNVNLEWLDLSGTPVKKIENLDTLVNLKLLDLNGSMVDRIENLDLNGCLERVSLQGTRVTAEECDAFEQSRWHVIVDR